MSAVATILGLAATGGIGFVLGAAAKSSAKTPRIEIVPSGDPSQPWKAVAYGIFLTQAGPPGEMGFETTGLTRKNALISALNYIQNNIDNIVIVSEDGTMEA